MYRSQCAPGLVSTHVDTSRKVARLAVALKARYRLFCGKNIKWQSEKFLGSNLSVLWKNDIQKVCRDGILGSVELYWLLGQIASSLLLWFRNVPSGRWVIVK